MIVDFNVDIIIYICGCYIENVKPQRIKMQEGCGQAVFSFKCKAVFLFGQNPLLVISEPTQGV